MGKQWKQRQTLFSLLLFSHSVVSDSLQPRAPQHTAHQATLSFTVSWNLVRLMSFESVMPSWLDGISSSVVPSPPAFCLFPAFQWVSPWGCQDSDTTEQLKNNNKFHSLMWQSSCPNPICWKGSSFPHSVVLSSLWKVNWVEVWEFISALSAFSH